VRRDEMLETLKAVGDRKAFSEQWLYIMKPVILARKFGRKLRSMVWLKKHRLRLLGILKKLAREYR
jgi:hypothetical protein